MGMIGGLGSPGLVKYQGATPNLEGECTLQRIFNENRNEALGAEL